MTGGTIQWYFAAVLETGSRPETKILECTFGIQRSPRLTVWLRRIPDDFPLKSRVSGDGRQQVPDADLVAGTQINGIAPVITFTGQHDALGRVKRVEELPGRRSVAPGNDGRLPGLFGLDALSYQRRDDVRGGHCVRLARAAVTAAIQI